MSIDAMQWAWKQPVKSSLKIVLLSLADRAGENHDCYPSIGRLSVDCSLSRSSVIRALNMLEQLGYIQKTPRITTNGNTSNYYKLLGVSDRHSPSVTVTPPPYHSDTPLVSHRHPPSVTVTPRNNNINTTINPNNNNQPAFEKLEKPIKPSYEIALLSLLSLSEEQKLEASKKLAALSPLQRDLAIQIFNKTVSQGGVKSSPMALLNQLVNLGLKNALEPLKVNEPLVNTVQVTKTAQKPVSDKELRSTRLEVIRAFVLSKKEELKKEFLERGFVTSKALGVIIEPDLRLAGLFD